MQKIYAKQIDKMQELTSNSKNLYSNDGLIFVSYDHAQTFYEVVKWGENMLDTYKYKVDFSEVQHYIEIHEILKRDLDFPDYYGGNLDALWDLANRNPN